MNIKGACRFIISKLSNQFYMLKFFFALPLSQNISAASNEHGNGQNFPNFCVGKQWGF